MSVFTFDSKQGNPITTEDLVALGADLGVSEKPEELEQYTKLLAVFHDACEDIMAMDDYEPLPDLDRFPRGEVSIPQGADNDWNAWGFKCNIVDARGPRGPLVGKTVVLKDMISVAGVPMMFGTDFIKDYVPRTDATVVTRLLEAGATVKGKAICENLCHSATSHSAATGPVDNPLAPGYSTGGSSSGCGALVADESLNIDIGIGADQGGSVRIPAGWSGIVGIKPTFGLIPYTGCGSNEATNDHLGVMTKDVLTNALGLQVVAGTDWIDDRCYGSKTTPYYDDLLKESGSLTGMKIALLKEGFDNPCVEERVKECCLNAVKKFEELGATVEWVTIPMHTKGPMIWTGISKVGNYTSKMAQANSRRGFSMNDLNEQFYKAMHTQESWEKLYPSSKNTFYNGAYALKKFPFLYGKCMNLSRKLKDDYNKCLEEFDLIVMPNLPYIAKPHTYTTAETKPLDLLSNQKGLSSNTAPFDQSGHPALSLPCGMLEIEEGPLAGSGKKLPVSLQLVAKWFDEKTIYKAAYAFEKKYNWRDL